MFCPECGRTDVELFEGVCKDCYLKGYQFLKIPENITVTVCKHCNAKLEGGKWQDWTEAPKDLEDDEDAVDNFGIKAFYRE